MLNWPKLEQEFNEAIAALPNYKREAVITYVAALRVRMKGLEDSAVDLADQVIKLEDRIAAQPNGGLL